MGLGSLIGGIAPLAGAGLGFYAGGPTGAMAGATVGAGIGEMLGAGDANQANWDNARAAESFAERMSSSAHVREVADLRAAGLNPILSANAGASTPAGVNSTSQNVVAGMTAHALEAFQVKQAMEKSEREIALMGDQSNKMKAETIASEASAEAMRAAAAKDAMTTRVLKYDANVNERKSDAIDAVINTGSGWLRKIQESNKNSAKPMKLPQSNRMR